MSIKTQVTMKNIEAATNAFLKMHWNADCLKNVLLPERWQKYDFKGAVAYGDRQGCYALIAENEVIYIGLGSSRGGGIYKEHGIGARLSHHVMRWDRSIPASIEERVFKPVAKWKGVSQVYTYGFPSGYGYLACSLESYLISKLEPKMNVTKTGSR